MSAPETDRLRRYWDTLAFTRLIASFKMAVGPAKLLTAFLAVALLFVAGSVMDLCMTASWPQGRSWTTVNTLWTASEWNNSHELEYYLSNTDRTMDELDSFSKGRGVFYTLYTYGDVRFNAGAVALLNRQVPAMLKHIWLWVLGFFWAMRYHPIYSVIFLTIATGVITIAGGAICRCAALEFAQGEKAGLTEAIAFGWQKFSELLTAPAIAVGIILFCCGLILAGGLAGNIPVVGEILIALFVPLAIILGIITSFALIGTVWGLGLMFPAIAYEGSDGLDSISRSIAYVFGMPVRLFFYYFVASIYGAVSYLFVRGFAFLFLIITYTLLETGVFNESAGPGRLEVIWPKPEYFRLLRVNPELTSTISQTISAILIHFTVLVVIGLLIAFVISFYFCSCTIIYALIRKRVDGTEINRIYVHLDQVRDEHPCQE
ncbi:MAG: hypothetical protein FVQ79_02515 [Planctomycetes bacterium]|nr:hypothetical protein [Planctomycetota bacterium]